MSLDLAATRLLLAQPKECIAAGFSADLFYDPFSSVVAHTVSFYAKYQSGPPVADIKDNFPAVYADLVGVQLKRYSTNPQYYVDALRARKRRDLFQALMNQVQEDSEGAKPDEIMAKMFTGIKSITTLYSPDDSMLLGDLTEAVDAVYKEVKSGQRIGFPLPFSHVDQALMGLRPGRLTAVAARPGMGKTWFLVMAAVCALARSSRLDLSLRDKVCKSDARVLFVSFEMRPEDVGRRIIATIAGVSSEKADKAQLDDREHKIFYDTMEMLKKDGPRLRIVGRSIKSVTDIEAAVDRMGADLLIVDAYYYLARGENNPKINRYEKLTAVIENLNHLKLSHDIPILIASQLNREGEVAGTDVLMQDADNVVRLRRDKKLERASQIDVSIMKGREVPGSACRRYLFDVDGAFTLRDVGEGFDVEPKTTKKVLR